MANPGFSEDHVEQAGIETLKGLGWRHLDGIAISPDGAAPQRALPIQPQNAGRPSNEN